MTKSRSLAMLLGNLSMLFPSFFSLFFLLILKPIWIKEVTDNYFLVPPKPINS